MIGQAGACATRGVADVLIVDAADRIQPSGISPISAGLAAWHVMMAQYRFQQMQLAYGEDGDARSGDDSHGPQDAVSVMGTPAAMMGTNREMNKVERATAKSDTTPRVIPKSSAPESPMKMEAG